MGHLIKILSLFWVLSIVGCLDLKKSDQSPVGIQGNGAGYGGGNGAGYGGGDNALTNARLLLVRSLIQFKDGVSQDDIANAEACLAQVRTPSLCNLLVGLAPTQKTFIVNFLKAHVQTLLDMNLGSNIVPTTRYDQVIWLNEQKKLLQKSVEFTEKVDEVKAYMKKKLPRTSPLLQDHVELDEKIGRAHV